MENSVQTYSLEDFRKLLQDPTKVDAFLSLLNAAAVVVGDFDDWGETLQSNDAGMYDETTAIEKLRGAVILISPGMVNFGDYLPHLTEVQQKKLEEVAAEIIAWGDGENIRDISYGKDYAETMTPRERLNQLKDDHDWRCKRLGFDPETGEKVDH